MTDVDLHTLHITDVDLCYNNTFTKKTLDEKPAIKCLNNLTLD